MDNDNKQSTPPPMPQANPVAPQPTPMPVQGTAYQMPPKKGLSGGALAAIIGGAVGLVLIIVAIVVVLILTAGPSKADYKVAYEKMQIVRTKYNSFSSSSKTYVNGLNSGSTGSTTRVESDMKDYKDAVKSLEGIKALKDTEIKKAYDEYVAKNQKLIEFMEGVVEAKDELNDVSDKCSAEAASSLSNADPKDFLNAYDKALGPCFDALDAMSKVKVKELAEYAKSVKALYDEQRQLMVKFQKAIDSGDSTQIRNIQSEIATQGRKFSSTSSEVKEFSDSVKNLDPSDELNKLGKLVTDKSNKA